MRKVFVLLVGLIGVLLFSSISIAAADTPPSVTVNSCSTTGLLVSASGTADDDNGMTSIYIYVDGIFVGGVDQYPPFGPHVSWTITNAAVPYGHQNKCIAITARATDTIGQTGTSGSCYAGIPERCWDGLENDCDGKTDCDDSGCEGQWCKSEDHEILTNWKCCSGSCVNTDTDPNNCGSCGNVCPPENPICEEGECVPEASTLVLFAVGLLSLVGYSGLKRRKTK